MQSEVTYSEPKFCPLCGNLIRIQYIDGKEYSLKESNVYLEATEKSPNPIYLNHNCIGKDESL